MIFRLTFVLSMSLFASSASQLAEYARNDYIPELEMRTNSLLDRLEAEPDVAWLLFLDIDETMVSNLEWIASRKFQTSLSAFNDYVKLQQGEAISSTQRLYRYAIDNHIPVVIATGRYVDQADDTKAVLKRVGYDRWDAIYFQERDNKQVASYKQSLRCRYQKQGFAVVNIGDQLSDLVGQCQDLTLQLPNPFYSTGYVIDLG